jgi:MYXO-CTERM domain-containing protein
MRRGFVTLFAGALVLSAPASGIPIFIEINEAGGSSFVAGTVGGRLNNNIRNGAPTTPDPSPVPAWPHLPGNPNVLTFTNFAAVAVNGDVLLGPPGGDTDTSDSDLIRFFGNQIVFYSDPPPDNGNFDAGVPGAHAGFIRLTEVAIPGGHDGVPAYTPAAGAIGFFAAAVGPNVFNPTYIFISDSPEPATWLFAAMGLGVLIARRRKRSSYPL